MADLASEYSLLADQPIVSSFTSGKSPHPAKSVARKSAAITAKLRMMKIPHKKTEVDPRAENAGASLERADYSANPSLALSVPADCGGMRLDQVLAQLRPQHSRSRLQSWIREGRVTVSGVVINEPKHKLWGGERLGVAEAPDERTESAQPE